MLDKSKDKTKGGGGFSHYKTPSVFILNSTHLVPISFTLRIIDQNTWSEWGEGSAALQMFWPMKLQSHPFTLGLCSVLIPRKKIRPNPKACKVYVMDWYVMMVSRIKGVFLKSGLNRI